MIKDCVYSEDGITYMSNKQYNNYIDMIEQLQQENQELKEEIKRVDERNKELVKICQEFDDRINKAIDYIESNDIEVLKYHDIPSETTSYEIVTVDLLKILKGGENGGFKTWRLFRNNERYIR